MLPTFFPIPFSLLITISLFVLVWRHYQRTRAIKYDIDNQQLMIIEHEKASKSISKFGRLQTFYIQIQRDRFQLDSAQFHRLDTTKPHTYYIAKSSKIVVHIHG